MRRVSILILALLSAAALGQTYQTGGKCTSGSNSCTVALTVTSGWVVVVGSGSSSGSGVTFPVPTDTDGVTFTACSGAGSSGSVTGPIYNPSSFPVEAFCATIGGSGSHSDTITIHCSSNNNSMGGVVAVYSGATLPYDKMATGTGSAGSMTTSNTPTTTSANELLVGIFLGGSSFGTVTAGTSYTIRQTSTSIPFGVIEDRNVTSTGAYAATATASSSNNYVGLIVTIPAAAGSASAPTCSTNCAGTYNNSVTATFANPNSGTTVMCGSTSTTPVTNGAGTGCTTGTTLGTGSTGTWTMSAAGTLKVVAGTSTASDSSVLSETYAFTVANPVPVYNAGATTSFSTTTSGASMYYNNSGGTPACPSTGTLYSGAISPSGTNSIQIIGCLTNYTASSVVTVQPDIAVSGTDNLQPYFNINWWQDSWDAGSTAYTTYQAIPIQLPIDLDWTNATWQNASSDGGEMYPVADSFLGGSAVQAVASGPNLYLVQSLRVKEGYAPNQAQIVYLHSSTSATNAGPAVRCNASGTLCISLIFSSSGNSVGLNKGTGASPTSLESTSSVTYSDGAFAELRAIGCVYTPLLNGSPITGLPAYTDTGCTQAGQPAIAAQASSSYVFGTSSPFVGLYNPSSYEIGATSSGYTPPSVPSPATYTDATLNTATPDMDPALTSPWFHESYYGGGGWVWAGSYSGCLVSGSTYALCDTVQPQYQYQNVFGVNEWQAFTINVAPWNANLGWWLATLLNQPWVYGLTAGGPSASITSIVNTSGTVSAVVNSTTGFASSQPITVAGVTNTAYNGNFTIGTVNSGTNTITWTQGSSSVASSSGGTVSSTGCQQQGTTTSCFDYVSYYIGITISNNYTCNSAKDEYCATPYDHGTKVTPQASPGNQVVTYAGSIYTLLPGDLVEDRYLNGFVESWCKQGSSPASWIALHTYAAGSWIKDSNGNVQYTSSGGVSGATAPTWGTTGSNSTNTWVGATTTDGTVTWVFYGAICPTTTRYTRMFHVADADLGNPAYVPGSGYTHALGIGSPGLASYGSATAIPLYNNWSAGTAGTTGEPCATAGQCVETGSIVSGGLL